MKREDIIERITDKELRVDDSGWVVDTSIVLDTDYLSLERIQSRNYGFGYTEASIPYDCIKDFIVDVHIGDDGWFYDKEAFSIVLDNGSVVKYVCEDD